MKRILSISMLVLLLMLGTACGAQVENSSSAEKSQKEQVTEVTSKKTNVNGKKVKVTVGQTEMIAVMEDNATSRAFMQKMPLTLSMEDLYNREMCYRYGNGGLPTEKTRSDGYQVGDIAYWPPRGSLVILYAQNGEHFERQQLGHIAQGVEIFKSTGNAQVKFEVINE